MRVKISYGVDIEDVPEEVQKLFDGISDWLEKLSKQQDTVDDLLETEELEPCVAIIKKMRETLGSVDGRLADLSLILQGYNNYMRQIGEQDETSEGRSPVDTTGSDAIQGSEQPDGSEIE